MDVMTDVDCFKIIQFGVMLLFWSSVHLAQVLWEIAADFWFIMYASPFFPVLVSLLSMGCMHMVMFGTPLVGPFGFFHVFRVCV